MLPIRSLVQLMLFAMMPIAAAAFVVPAQAAGPETVLVPDVPALTLTKAASPTSYNSVGQVISYTLVATNGGDVTLTDVSISDPTLGALACSQPVTLTAGATLTCTGSYTVTQVDLTLGTIINTGAVTGTPGSYVATLSGAAESPSNNSAGTGSAIVDIDTLTHTMRIQASFSGLTGTTTVAHIHAATPDPFSGTAGVATQTPTFVDFPAGVTSGSYDHTFDLTQASSWNPAFVTAHGGTAAGAEAFFTSSVAAGKAYLNIHSTAFPGGEIRGFLARSAAISATASVTVTAVQTPALTLTKAASPTSYNSVGQVISYTLVATNTGAVTLADVSISDPKVGALTCSQPVTLTAGTTLTCTGRYTVTQADIDLAYIINTGAVTGTPGSYVATLSGAAESPSNNSAGTGSAIVDIDSSAHSMRIRASFSGLTGTTTAAHIHAATTEPFSGTAGVATQIPTFVDFPAGVTSGSYDHTFDLTQASSWNPAFVTAHGGTAAGAEAFFTSSVAAGKTYLNIHSTAFPGGEIRGFLARSPVSATASLQVNAALQSLYLPAISR